MRLTMDQRILEHLMERGSYILNNIKSAIWQPFDYSEFYIAGGCMCGQPNDIDIYPVAGYKLPEFKGEIVSDTKNAKTYQYKKVWPIQVCSYYHATLKNLVESFDYSHIQAGVYVANSKVQVAYASSEFILAKVTDTPQFTGSEYPLSSLLRAGKYYKRGVMTRGQYMRCVLSALTAVVARGFHDYEDFKDQLDAVDLGLTDAAPELGELFEVLKHE